ncbi:MAG: class IV adenylate cyclase [Pirellulaceae bacterium]
MSKFEIELKFKLHDAEEFRRSVLALGATPLGIQKHRDTYFNHPCRDFAQTHEALRVRRIDGRPLITYKGSKLAGPVKTRPELEWELGPGDVDGGKTEALLEHLGFRRVADVVKVRESFEFFHGDPPTALTITIDKLDTLGAFAEIECVAEQEQMEFAQRTVTSLSEQLELRNAEPRSYLRMLLEDANL